MQKQRYIATKNDHNRKILKFIQSIYANTPMSKIYRTFRQGDIKVNNKRVKDFNYIIQQNDIIEVYGISTLVEAIPYSSSTKLQADIIYEDNNILIINKPNNIAVHSEANCLDEQVLSYLNVEFENAFKPSHVGRLDKVTSGLMLYAKNYSSLVQLNKKQHSFIKQYIFIPECDIKPNIYEFYIEKDEVNKRMKTTQKSVFSQKSITKIEYINNTYYATLLTGKKHQIRLCCAALNAPIKGDVKYGAKSDKRLYLHSYLLKFDSLEADLEYLNNKEFRSLPNW